MTATGDATRPFAVAGRFLFSSSLLFPLSVSFLGLGSLELKLKLQFKLKC